MRYFLFITLLCFALAICGCDNTKEEARAQEKQSEQKALPAPTSEELALADKILKFNNSSQLLFAKDYLALPEAFHQNAQKYTETWCLPKKPRIYGRTLAAKGLAVPQGIFTEEEEKILTQAYQDMDKAIQGMLSDYGNLEKYVNDDSIKDDGKQGLLLADKIAGGRSQFMAAKRTWLGIMNARAEQAEKLLLAGHPLERQIMAAQNIFADFKAIALLLRADQAPSPQIKELRENLLNIIDAAGRPPFTAQPALERLYREFLKKATQYCHVLGRGIAEGFHSAQLKEINAAAQATHAAYNEFARQANFYTNSSN